MVFVIDNTSLGTTQTDGGAYFKEGGDLVASMQIRGKKSGGAKITKYKRLLPTTPPSGHSGKSPSIEVAHHQLFINYPDTSGYFFTALLFK